VTWTGYVSMTDWNTMRRVTGLLPETRFIGLDNYAAVFATPRFWTNDVFNNVVFTVVFVGGCIAVGLLLAILVDQHIRGEAVFRSIFLFPMALSFVVTGTVWAWILNPTEGVNVPLDAIGVGQVRETLLGIGFLQPVWDALDTLRVNLVRPGLTADPRAVLGALGLAAIWQMSGFVMALYLAGLRGVGDELREAARVDGATEVGVYRRIVLPLLRPITVSAIILLGYTSLKMFDLVFVLTRGGPALASDLPSIFMFETTFRGNQWARGAAVAMLMLLASAVLLIPYVRTELRRTAR
jgi:glucose/mannose transport system permease protein